MRHPESPTKGPHKFSGMESRTVVARVGGAGIGEVFHGDRVSVLEMVVVKVTQPCECT